MAKKKHAEFVENDLIGDHQIETTILDETLPESEPIETARDHPEQQHPGTAGARKGGKWSSPPRNDPRHADQSVLPGRNDLPAGSERHRPSGSS